MEALAAVGLVQNIAQFVDYGGQLIAKSIELYHSYDGALAENVDIETVTKHLAVLIKGLKDNAIIAGDDALQDLSHLCQNAAIDLLVALDKVKVKSRQQRWSSIRKALRSVWTKQDIRELEQRLVRLKEALNFRVVVQLREQASEFKREHSITFQKLDLATQSIFNAIVDRQDVFQVVHEAQLTLTKTLHEDTMRNIDDTRQDIIREIEQQQQHLVQQERWLDKLPIATQAAFNSVERQHDPICLRDTRVGVLKEIGAWADGEDERCIYWLNGLAGTGKSTIARTIAREYFQQNRLGASFFFSKGGGDVGHASKFFTTLAFQLAKRSPVLKKYICEAISQNEDIKHQSFRDQWRQLILQPLSKLDGNPWQSYYILVIDALDECDGDNDIRAILQLLAEARSLLRVFLTSRPEIPIRHGFYELPEAKHQDFVLHNILSPVVDRDISIFLKHDLGLIRQEFYLDANWPTEQVIALLVQNAHGLFIWAATAYRFIREGKQYAPRRLETILAGSSTSVTSLDKHLDTIYDTVLSQSIPPEFTKEEKEELSGMLRQILGCTVVLLSPLSVKSLRRLLDVAKQEIDQTLDNLHAILDIPKDPIRPLRLHHPSFRDFLLNKDRCSDPNFLVDEKQAHRTLAQNCVQLMSTFLKQDICDVGAPGTLMADVLSSRAEHYLAPEVQYACLYWVQHIQKSETRLYDGEQVHLFLQKHLLHWFEALSLLGKTSEGVLAISSLESYIQVNVSPNLYAFIHDAKRFALRHRSIIEYTPLQIYSSALIFIPESSVIRRQFKEQLPHWIARLPKIQTDWSAALQTLEGHTDSVGAVAFSYDGKLLASVSDDRTVRLWDSITGAALQKLEGHTSSVWAVAFSHDGKLASASVDRTVRLWDPFTGAALRKLEGHTSSVKTVLFSHDGKILVSTSMDRTVRLWDSITGAALQIFEGYISTVGAVVFSHDDKLLISASYNRAVKLWDLATGVALQKFEGDTNSFKSITFSHDGKLLASASVDRTVKLWDPFTGAALQTLEGHTSSVWAIAFSHDDKILASASVDRTVRLWDTVTGAALQKLEGHTSPVWAVIFSHDSKLLASASYDATVRLWDPATRAAPTLESHTSSVGVVAFSYDGNLLASASGDRVVRLWNPATGAALQKLEGHTSSVGVIVFSFNGKLLASASDDRTVRLWDTTTGAALQTLKGHTESLRAVAFSYDGKLLASASDGRIVRLWDPTTGAALQKFEGHTSSVWAVAFSHDNKLLASTSVDRTVRLWNPTTGAALQKLEGHADSIRTVAFSHDGKLLASVSDDRTMRLWDLITGAALQTLEIDKTFYSISFSRNARYLKTDRGLLSLQSSTNLSSPPEASSHQMFIEGDWITRDGKNLLWLPSNYKVRSSALHDNMFAIGHLSGEITVIEFRS